MIPRSTGLDTAITAIIAHQRVLGRGYGPEADVLDRCGRFVRDAGATGLDRPLFDRWCETQQHLAPLRDSHGSASSACSVSIDSARLRGASCPIGSRLHGRRRTRRRS